LSPSALCAKVYNEIKKDPQGDIHGGEYETSCILHIAPHLVDTGAYTNEDAIRCNSPLRGPVSTWGLQETKTGLFGDPTYAQAETGRLCLEAAVREGLKLIKLYYEHREQSGSESIRR
ncbi:MAG: creatininase family protein, partial [Treponema sp.]|jgi:creatinine amidohydrolase|nr:creatininase family protein [Treponema sp.]